MGTTPQTASVHPAEGGSRRTQLRDLPQLLGVGAMEHVVDNLVCLSFDGDFYNVAPITVIGAYSVVCKDVEPWTFVACNPSRVIRKQTMRGN